MTQPIPPEVWPIITIVVAAIIRWIERGRLIRKQKKEVQDLVEKVNKYKNHKP